MSDKCPAPMKKGGSKRFKAEKKAVQKLVEKLRTQASPRTIEEDLTALSEYFQREVTGSRLADAFVRAGGLPILIGQLRSTSSVATSSPSTQSDITASAIPNAKTLVDALLELEHALTDPATLLAMPNAFEVMDLLRKLEDALTDPVTLADPALKDNLRNTRFNIQGLATGALRALAIAQPVQIKAIAEAGVMGRLLELYTETGDLALESLGPGTSAEWFSIRIMALARLLLESGTIAAEDLKRAICAPSPVQSFGAIALLQDCMTLGIDAMAGCDLVGALDDAGVVDALVATLANESPYCVAAAAGVLGLFRHNSERGKAAVEASGVVAAMVCVMKRFPLPGDPETETGLFRRTVFKVKMDGERLHFRNPTGLALAGLWLTAPYTGPMLDSFVEAGGVPAVVRVLGESSCPLTLRYCLALIRSLMGELDPPGTRSRSQELADEVFRSGFCKAALRALENGIKAVREDAMSMLAIFFTRLSVRSHAAAMAALVAGGAVEVAIRHMDEEGAEMHVGVLALLTLFQAHPDGRKKMYAHGIVGELVDWFPDGRLKPQEGDLLSHMYGRGKKQADSQMPPSGAAGPAPSGGRPGPSGARRSCHAARRTWTCSRCGVSAAEMLETGKLKECTGCRSVRYCGKACQKADWPEHKAMCKRVPAAGK